MCRFIVFLVIAACHLHQISSQMSMCKTGLKYGGECVDKRASCPADSIEYPEFSNYLGCETVTRKCCASTLGIVKNPDGIEIDIPRTCGIGSLLPSSRILDGDITEPCDWPFVASIRTLISASSSLTYNETRHACQGTFIAKNWVITSPVCIISAGYSFDEAIYRMLIVGGEYNVNAVDIDPATRAPQEQLIRAKQIFVHPDYKFTRQDEIIPFKDMKAINSNGVALIKLAEPISGRCSGIACLPTESEAANKCSRQDVCVITGWGFNSETFETGPSNELLIGQNQVISDVACDYLTQKLGLNDSRPEGTLCQSPRSRNTDGCFGDEGGAVLCSLDFQNWVIRAIIPFNVCLQGRYNFFYTSVGHYLQWIQTTMRNNS